METSTRQLNIRPRTNLGSWSVWLEFAFVLMFAINIPVNMYLIADAPFPAYYAAFILFMLACGLAGGILGWMAVVKRRERSILVWVAIAIGLFVLLLVSNELMQGIRYMLDS